MATEEWSVSLCVSAYAIERNFNLSFNSIHGLSYEPIRAGFWFLGSRAGSWALAEFDLNPSLGPRTLVGNRAKKKMTSEASREVSGRGDGAPPPPPKYPIGSLRSNRSPIFDFLSPNFPLRSLLPGYLNPLIEFDYHAIVQSPTLEDKLRLTSNCISCAKMATRVGWNYVSTVTLL